MMNFPRIKSGSALLLCACFAQASLSGCTLFENGETNETGEPKVQSSVQPNLQWKRHAALEADIARALELERDELCQEFGSASCIREAHLVPLGGHDPFATGLLSPSKEPLATTPAAVDRVVLSACSRRVHEDEKSGPAEARVFDRLDLSDDAPSAESKEVRRTIVELYRRFLARNPDDHELLLVASLAVDDDGDPRSASEFATLSCYAIGTTTEFLFF